MSNIIDAIKPSVRIDGVDRDDMVCLQVEEQSGVDFSKALFRFVPGRFENGPIALKQYGEIDEYSIPTYRQGQRVVVYDADTSTIYFHGFLSSRQDSISSDTIHWTAYGDQWLLQYIPIRGCLVKDDDDNLVLSTRHSNQVNPGGLWNCTGYQIGDVVYPVFTPSAYRYTAYSSPTETFDGTDLELNKYQPWTPRRYLQYLQLIATVYDTFGSWPDGMSDEKDTSLNTALNLTWSRDSIDYLVGYDPASILPGESAKDPLDRKMPNASFNGDTVLGAIKKTLDICGTHELKILYDSTILTAGLSKVEFMPWGYTASGTGKTISLQRAGRAGDESTQGELIDGTLDESMESTFSTILVEGDTINVETSLTFTSGSESESGIIPAWTSDEEAAFLACIHGGTILEISGASELGDQLPEFALLPDIHTSTTIANFIQCDGEDGRPLARARTPEAVAYAREAFPTVYRAWKLNQDVIEDIITSPDDSSVAVVGARPVLPQQLQYYLRDLNGGVGAENWLLDKMPIRVEVKQDDDSYKEIPRDVSVRIESDGTIWIEGIAESMDPKAGGALSRFCVYSKSLYDYRDYISAYPVSIRDIRVNIALQTDTRVNGKASTSLDNVGTSIVDSFYGAGLIRYIDRPGAYSHDYQYNSTPTASPQFYAGDSGISAPLTRDLPPGSEAIHATYDAERLLATAKNFRRSTKWSMWGIRHSIRAGDWLQNVYLKYVGYQNEYTVNAAIPSVHWDFEKQITTFAGVLGEYDT